MSSAACTRISKIYSLCKVAREKKSGEAKPKSLRTTDRLQFLFNLHVTLILLDDGGL